jgi:Fe-Mn family superoxide dismutase
MIFKLPDLPFPQDSLMPHMSAKTLSFHHGKHHKSYVDKLNAAVEGTAFADMKLEEIVQKTANDPTQKGIFNNAAQHWNHSFFWSCLTPDGGGKPEGKLARQIDADFGSYDKFKKAFSDVAAGQFGSGWAWLVVDGGKLKVTATANAELPLMFGQNALLTCDVWEHAYYLDYQNRRPDFVEAFLNSMVNWSFAGERFANQGEGNSTAARLFRKAQESIAAASLSE